MGLARPLRLESPEMPDLSQRTLAHVMTVPENLIPEDADTYPLRQKFWQQTLLNEVFLIG